MSELEEIRRKIHEVDADMAGLFEKRMHLAGQVLDYKAVAGIPVYDPVQEARLIAGNVEGISDPVIKEYYVLFLQKLMELSRDYQGRLIKKMKVAYSGVPGAFAYIAAEKLFPGCEPVGYPDFESAYRACGSGEADVAMLPVENSYAGDVGGVMDLSFSGNLFINMMVELGVSQNLLGLPGASIEGVRTVVSHPQALAQCASFISRHGFSTRESENTALAARLVAESGDPTLAAVASADTAGRYGLEILERNINSSVSNSTRFAVFSRVRNTPAGGNNADESFILVFTVKNEAGALAKVLNVIGSHSFNMSNLHSRPMKGRVWRHYFFAELEGSVNSEDGRDLLRQMNTVCDKLKLVGTYRKLTIDQI